MAAITTAAPGAWSSTGTWTGGVIPGNGDTVTLNHAVTVTDSRTVGVSPTAGAGTNAIRCNAKLTIDNGGTLVVRGDIGLNNVGLDIGNPVTGGGVLEFDASAAGTPSTALYRCYAVNSSDPNAIVTIYGISSNRSTIRSNAGGANGRFVDNGNDRSGMFIGTFCDFTRIGNSSNVAIRFIMQNADTFSLLYCTFDACGAVGDKFGVNSSAQSKFTVDHCRFINTPGGDSLGPVFDTRTGTGIRAITFCDVDKAINWYNGGGVAQWTIEDSVIRGGYDTTGGQWASFKRNVIALEVGAEVGCHGTMEQCHVVRIGAPSNPHYVTTGDTTIRITRCHFECPDGNGGETSGDCISLHTPGSTQTVTIDHNIVMHRLNNNPGTMLSCLGGSNLTVVADHNTYHGGQGIYLGETYGGHADMVSSCASNLMYVKSGTGRVITADSGVTTNIVSAANCHHNGKWNPNGTGYDGTLSFSPGTPGANDVSGNPSFVDVDRNIKTWDSSLGGPGTLANALNEIGLGNRTVAALLTYIRDGFTPTNAAFHAAHDNVPGSNGWIGAVGPEPTLEQEGFRFYNDDAGETSATAKAAQDTNITEVAGVNIRPRFLINSVNDPAAFSAQLEHRINGGSWQKTEVPSGSLAFGTAGAATTTGTTAPTVAYPASIAAGDLLVLAIVNRPNANTPTTPSGWTAGTNYTQTGGAGSEAADTGTVRTTVFTKIADGTETGSLTLAITSGTSVGAVMFRVPRCPGKVFDLALVNGSDNSAGTGWSVTMGANPGIDAGDLIYVLSGCSADTPTFASEALSATGATFGTMTERLDQAITTGNDCKLVVAEFPVSTGPASAAPVFTMTASGTASASAAGSSVLLRIRLVTAAVTISPSSNISASGQNTTARLTAPSGKTTSDFVAGRIQDDENPADSVDITTDDYTEFEWCVTGSTALLVTTDTVDFRVTRAGILLDTYTVTPRWTIGTSSTPVSQTFGPGWESIQPIAATRTAPHESRQPIAQTRSPAYESKAPLAATPSAPWESKQPLSGTTLPPWESRQPISAGPILPFESRQPVAGSPAPPWESRQGIAASLGESWESRQGILTSFVAPWESIGRVARALDLPWEAQGVAGAVSQFFVVGWESRAPSSAAPVIGYESRQPMAATQVISFESLRGLLQTMTLSTEQRGAIAAALTESYESRSPVLVTFAPNYESKQPLSVSAVLPHEWRQNLSRAQLVAFESRGRIAQAIVIPWEAGSTGVLPGVVLVFPLTTEMLEACGPRFTELLDSLGPRTTEPSA